MERLLCPSMMCADYDNLAEDVKVLDQGGADIFHVDIMDGAFVPNFAMGMEDFKCIRRNTKKPVDVHLMVNAPQSVAPLFAKAGADIVYVHVETDPMIGRTLDAIREAGAHPGIAVNPGTAAESLTSLLPIVDYVMVMTVNPGFAGQKYLPYVDEKIEKLIAWKEKWDYKIVTDGAMSPQQIRRLSVMGVDGFVLGTSALFGKGVSYGEILEDLRR